MRALVHEGRCMQRNDVLRNHQLLIAEDSAHRFAN
jgi:hypothetical protein